MAVVRENKMAIARATTKMADALKEKCTCHAVNRGVRAPVICSCPVSISSSVFYYRRHGDYHEMAMADARIA